MSLLLLLFTFDELLVFDESVVVVFVQDLVHNGSWVSSLTISQFCVLLETVIANILAVTEFDVDVVAVVETADVFMLFTDDAEALFRSRPDFCCCSRCNRVVTPDVNESTIH